MSPKGQLSKQDFKEWLVQTLEFSVLLPGGYVFITSLQSGVNIKVALAAATIAVAQALYNLLMKLNAGQETTLTATASNNSTATVVTPETPTI